MTENIITWNIPNTITIGVMGVVMFTVFGFVASWLKSRQQG